MIILPNALEACEHSYVRNVTVCKVGLSTASRLLNILKANKKYCLASF